MCDSFSATFMTHYHDQERVERCGRHSPDYLNNLRRFLGSSPIAEMKGQNVGLRFKTDDSIHVSGINMSFIVLSDSRKLLLRSCSVFEISDAFVKHGSRERNGAMCISCDSYIGPFLSR